MSLDAMTTPARLTRLDFLVASGLLVVVLVAGGIRMVPGVIGVYQDDGVYAITARALAQGDGYRLINLPGEPRQTKYPILFPALLAGVWTVWPDFPANAVAMQWLTLAAAASAISLSYLFLVAFRLASRAIAGASALLSSLIPMFLYLSTLPMSEAVFALLVVLALWRGQSALIAGTAQSRSQQFMTGILIALPFLCRGFGAAVVAGVLVAFVRAGRPVAWVGVGSAAVVVPWAWWAWFGLGSDIPEVTGYYTNYADSLEATFSANGLRIIGLNLVFILTATLGLALDGLRLLSGPAAGGVTLTFLIAGVAAWWRIGQAAWRGHVLAACLVAYCGIAVVWPWPPARFLLPVLPLLVAYSVTQLASVVPWRGLGAQKTARWSCALAVAIGVYGQLGSLSEVSAKSRAAGYPFEPAFVGVGARRMVDPDPGNWRSYAELFTWIRGNSQPTDVVACGLDTVMYLYTDRKSFRPAVHRPEARYGIRVSSVGTPAEVQRLLERGGARYLALVPGFIERQALADAVLRIQKNSPGLLELVYTGRDVRFVVFKVRADDRR